MKLKCIVNADFYPDGSVVPLSITDGDGYTIYINKSECLLAKGDGTQLIGCAANSRKFLMWFANGKFDVEEPDAEELL